MPTFSLFSLLICFLTFAHAMVLERAAQTNYAPAKYTNSTTRLTLTSTITSTVTKAPTLCTACRYGEPGSRVEFQWPAVSTTEMVLATVVYKVDPNNVTSTITRYSNTTLGSYDFTVLDAAQWNKILHTTGVTLENGTPHFKYVTTVYSAPGAPITVSATL